MMAARRGVQRTAMLAAMVLAIMAGGAASAQDAKAPYPPRDVDMRAAETLARQQQAREARHQWQDSRVRRLTGSGDNAAGQVRPVAGSNAVAAARVAVQSVIGAFIAAAAISAVGEEAGILVEAGSGSVADEESSSTGGTTSTSSSTSTN